MLQVQNRKNAELIGFPYFKAPAPKTKVPVFTFFLFFCLVDMFFVSLCVQPNILSLHLRSVRNFLGFFGFYAFICFQINTVGRVGIQHSYPILLYY